MAERESGDCTKQPKMTAACGAKNVCEGGCVDCGKRQISSNENLSLKKMGCGCVIVVILIMITLSCVLTKNF